MGLLDAIGGLAGGPYGAILGGVGSIISGLLTKTPHVQPRGLTLGDPLQGQQQFLDQGKNIGDVSKLLGEANRIDNLKFQQQASQFAPNLFGNIKQNAENTSAMLGGGVTQGMMDASGKQGATGRDFGLTPYQLELRGANRVGIEGDTARSLNPFNETATDTLISPAALLKRQDQLDQHNNEILNQGRLMQAGASGINPVGQGISTGLGGLFGSLRGYGTVGGDQTISSGYGFGFGDSGPTADSNFSDNGTYLGFG